MLGALSHASLMLAGAVASAIAAVTSWRSTSSIGTMRYVLR